MADPIDLSTYTDEDLNDLSQEVSDLLNTRDFLSRAMLQVTSIAERWRSLDGDQQALEDAIALPPEPESEAPEFPEE